MQDERKLLLFGASGAIGQALSRHFQSKGWLVIKGAREARAVPDEKWLMVDPFGEAGCSALADGAPYSAVCWAQGMNVNDSVHTVDAAINLEMYRANCLFIIVTLQRLLQEKLLGAGARLCIISSIWQKIARQNKLSYSMTKAALQGLILSASVDLGKDGYLINAVLPGALDTPMTRRNLSPQQLEQLQGQTYFGRLPMLEDVCAITHFLCSEENRGITGQFIAADLGFSNARIL